jgi:hypothetical protein
MHTAICAFDDRARAEEAKQRLLQAGFARHDVHIEHKHMTGHVVTVHAGDEAQAQRAEDLLRDIASRRAEPAAMVERSRVAYESWSPTRELAGERAMASHRLDAIGGPKLRDPELEHPPGLRYADKDKPLG